MNYLISEIQHFLSIPTFIRTFRTPKSRAAQSLSLILSSVLSMGLSFLTGIITANALGPEKYGDLKFIQTFWSIFNTLLAFGLLNSASRVLLIENDENNLQEVYGTTLLLGLGIGTAIALLQVATSKYVDQIFHTNLAGLMNWVAVLAVIIPLQNAMGYILQSANKIYLLIGLNVLPVLLYLVCLEVVIYFNNVSTGIVLALQQITVLAVIISICVWIKPKFIGFKTWFSKIRKENKTYGFPVYLGAISAIVTGQLNRLAISYWTDTKSIGFYSLAVNLTDPIRLIPSAVSTASIRDFARQKQMARRLVIITIFSTACIMLLAWFFYGKPLSWLYKSGFDVVGPMARVAMFGAVTQGFGEFLNRFLGAHGYGSALRNTSYVLGAVNIAGLFLFTPVWGAWGALITMVIMGGTNLVLMLFYYRKLSKSVS